LSGDDRVLEAKIERDRVRLTLKRERFCVLHECRPPMSAPLTTLAVRVDDVDAKAAAVLMKRRAALARLTGVISLAATPEAKRASSNGSFRVATRRARASIDNSTARSVFDIHAR
jgi:hypothetical protein